MSSFGTMLTCFCFCVMSPTVRAISEISGDGVNFFTSTSPVTMVQNDRSNVVGIVEMGNSLDSASIQTGDYNRTAIFQLGNANNLAIVDQLGNFNRALIVQVANSENTLQNIDIQQRGGADAINNLFQFQVSSGDESNPVAYGFSTLTFDQAKTVATNFIYGPESSRVNVGLLEDISLHFGTLLKTKLDQDRFKHHDTYSSVDECKEDSACSTLSTFTFLGYERTTRDNKLGISGYGQNIRSATIGADFFVEPTKTFGIALNLEKSASNIEHGLGNVDTVGYQFGAFGSFLRSQYYLDLIATLGKVNFETERFGGAMAAHSDVDGWSYTGLLQTGYSFSSNGFRFSPFLSATYSKGTVDAYWETGNTLTTQWINKQTRKKFAASLGASLDHKDYIGGSPFYSYLKAEIERDFGIQTKNQIISRFSFSQDTVFTPIDNSHASTQGKISGGVEFSFTKKISIALTGMTLIGPDNEMDKYSIHGGLLINF
ncbi:Autotransporter domain-containing protein [Gammaproteobacteria bacterium]